MTKRTLSQRWRNVFRQPQAIPKRLYSEYYQRVLLPVLLEESRNRWAESLDDRWRRFRLQTLSFVEANHLRETGIGAYSYVIGGPPILYASCYAALTRHLYGDLASLSGQERNEWTWYIKKHQRDDGLFYDPLLDCPEAEICQWWGWSHPTLHALMALTALGDIAPKPFRVLDVFRIPGKMIEWLNSRNWKQDAAAVSNEIQNYGVMLQYARDFHGQLWCNDVLGEMYDWLDRHQDSQTGSWGYGVQSAWERSQGVQTGYHIWLLYFYDGRPIQYVEQIIDSCLATQNRMGGFGVSLNSSACEDIDSIDPLVRLSFITDYRKADIHKALKRALVWILANFNLDGGAVFRRGEDFRYGHDLMFARAEQSAMFPTWFRNLTLAYLSQVVVEAGVERDLWQFILCPGHQFWILPQSRTT